MRHQGRTRPRPPRRHRDRRHREQSRRAPGRSRADPGRLGGPRRLPTRARRTQAQTIGEASQHVVCRGAGLSGEGRPQHGQGIVSSIVRQISLGNLARVEPVLVATPVSAYRAQAPSSDGSVGPCDGVILPPRGKEAVDDCAMGQPLRVTAEQSDRGVHVSVVVGEFEQHPVDVEAPQVVTAGLLGIQVGNPSSVDRDALVAQRRREHLQRRLGPARTVLSELQQPACELDPVRMSFHAGSGVEVGSALARVPDHAAGVVGLQGHSAGRGEGLEQRWTSSVGPAMVQELFQLVEDLVNLRADLERAPVMDEAARRRGVLDSVHQRLGEHRQVAGGEGRSRLERTRAAAGPVEARSTTSSASPTVSREAR